MKYNIIHLNGFMYVVDKAKRVPNQDEWFYNLVTNTIHQLKEVPEGFLEISNRKIGLWTILIASNDPSLNLPLLPTVEEDIEHLATEIVRKGGGWEHLYINNKLIHKQPPNPTGFWRDVNNVIAGYKAASAKKYTEEDLKDAMKVAMKQASSGSSFEDRDFINRHIQFLTPKPIAVELETKVLITDGTYNGRTENEYVPMEFVKTDSTNHVIVKQWYFNV